METVGYVDGVGILRCGDDASNKEYDSIGQRHKHLQGVLQKFGRWMINNLKAESITTLWLAVSAVSERFYRIAERAQHVSQQNKNQDLCHQ